MTFVLLVIGPVAAQDFTVQGNGNFNRDLPQRLTAGTWQARVSVPVSDRIWLLQVIPYDGYDGHYGSLSFDEDAPSNATFRVGTDRGADVPLAATSSGRRSWMGSGASGSANRGVAHRRTTPVRPQHLVTAPCRTVSSASCSALPRTANALTAS